MERPGTRVRFRSVSDARRDWPLNQRLGLFPRGPSPARLDCGAGRTTNFWRCIPEPVQSSSAFFCLRGDELDMLEGELETPVTPVTEPGP